MTTARSRFASILLEGESSCATEVAAKVFFVSLVLLSIAAIVFETAEAFARSQGGLLQAVEYLTVALFAAEYLLRVWVAPELAPNGLVHPAKLGLAIWCRYLASST